MFQDGPNQLLSEDMLSEINTELLTLSSTDQVNSKLFSLQKMELTPKNSKFSTLKVLESSWVCITPMNLLEVSHTNASNIL